MNGPNDPKRELTREPPMRRNDAPAGLFLDATGAWYHDGDWVRHERLCALLSRSIARDDEDNLIVTTGRDVLPFSAAVAPFVVRTIEPKAQAWELVISDGTREPLSSATKFAATEAGAFFVVVKQGKFWATLARIAVQALMPYIGESPSDEKQSHLRLALPTPLDIPIVDDSAIDFCAVPNVELHR